MHDSNPLQYLQKLKPAEFDKYIPPKGVLLTATQVQKLYDFVSLLPTDRNMMLYFWRFVFGIDIKTIRRYAKIDNANGIIEALRFACKRYLELDKPISNHGMSKVFERVISDYEIVFVSADKGICWFSNKSLDAVVIKNALEERA